MPSSPGPAPRQEPDIVVSPPAAPAESEVQVSMGDLPPGMVVLVGFGGVGTPHEILTETTTDGAGTFAVEVRIPRWTERNRNHFFYMAYADQRPRVFSEPFLVCGPNGEVRLEGVIGDEGVECLAMRGDDDALYTLTGEVGTPAPGTRVVVEGRVAEMSTCQQGLTLEVREIRRM